MTEPVPEHQHGPFSGRAAFVISQSYYYLAAVIGVGLLLGGAIAALIAIRQWVLPSDASYGPGSDATREAVRSLLGALAFAIPGALVFTWHFGEARRRETAYRPGAFWGSALYFHLVALIALAIALGGAIGALHSLRDAALPYCFGQREAPPSVATLTPVPGASPGVEIPIGEVESPLLGPECYPPSSESLRSALDGAIVAGVAGGVWIWHLRRGRRDAASPAPPTVAPREPEPPPGT